MERDIRKTALYEEAEALYRMTRQPGAGQISDASEVHVAANGGAAVFSGLMSETLEGPAQSRICLVDLTSGDTRVLTFGPNTDRLAKWSPDGSRIAFLSDRQRAGDFQLYLLAPSSGAVRPTAHVQGWVEYFHWSPNGERILLGVAGYGADVSGAQGAVTSRQAVQDIPAWVPSIDTGDESFRWRRLWVYEAVTNCVRQVGPSDTNVWEAVWCGDGAFAAVVSPGPGEGLWYGARLDTIDAVSGEGRTLYQPEDQPGVPAATPSGRHVAIVDAVCSDRGLVAGDVRLIETASGKSRKLDSGGVDVAFAEWRSDSRLLLAGHRGFETVVGMYDLATDTFSEVWASREISTGGIYVTVSGYQEQGDCVLVGEGFTRAPEIGVMEQGRYRTVKSFDLGPVEYSQALASVDCVSWRASDGLEIQGWLLRPVGSTPHPVILNVHGGPVWQWRPSWLGRRPAVLMLLGRGYAAFFPNPRGSSGYGQAFARRVLGDMGGADTYDYLSGLDALAERGLVDPTRIGVTGTSYGGFMSSWLIAHDPRFAAAVPVAPVNNYVTEHLLSNIPHWPALFLADSYHNPGGKYFERSPVMHAHKVKTPTLNICGALDRSAPPEEAVQFHNALLGNGTRSVLVTYPREGHGIRQFPAVIDYAARVVSWFTEHV